MCGDGGWRRLGVAIVSLCMLLTGVGTSLAAGSSSGTDAEGTELGFWPLDHADDDEPRPGLTQDRSGNDLHLTEHGDPVPRESPDNTFDEGYALDGEDDYLRQHTHVSGVDGSLSLLVAFEVRSSGDEMALVDIGTDDSDRQGNALHAAYLQIQRDLGIRYHHDAADAPRPTGHPDVNVESTDASQTGRTLTEGWHTLTLQRDAVDRELRIEVDGDLYIQETWTSVQDPVAPEDPLVWAGALQGTARYLDGGVDEIRLWDRLVDDRTLDCLERYGAAGPDCPIKEQPSCDDVVVSAFDHRVCADSGLVHDQPGDGCDDVRLQAYAIVPFCVESTGT